MPARGSVAVLGGGMAALTAAFELSEGDWRDRFESITVYQRGWRLGGKGASSRGLHGRIEEHGLHVLLGYYDQTFEVLRRCYEELDRPRSDPGAPLLTWDDAVAPSNLAGVVDRHGAWDPWVASFGRRPGRPGQSRTDPLPPTGTFPLQVADIVTGSLRLLLDFFGSLAAPPRQPNGRVSLSTSPDRPTLDSPTLNSQITSVIRGAGLVGLALSFSWAERLIGLAGSNGALNVPRGSLLPLVEPLRASLREAVVSDDATQRTHHLIELVIANLAGIAVDGLLMRPDGFDSIDHLDYREWLSRHGIAREALESPILRGMYDLAFAYEGGDGERPRFSAGLGLQLATRMLFGYSGALFWKMQAGMGEVVFAPLYQVLAARGVEFRFFHRVDALRLAPDGRSVEAVELGVQAETVNGDGHYDPLVSVKGLPCWPDAPLTWQLENPADIDGLELESFWSPRRDAGRRTLLAGRDFDTLVFGISLGMVPHVCGELLEHSAAWREMVVHLGTVATQSLQLWLAADERALGWAGPEGSTVSGFVKPFDTWASMSHLLPLETWPASGAPRTLAYFCGALPETDLANSPVEGPAASDAVATHARRFLDEDIAALWPSAATADGFRWDLLCDGTPTAGIRSDAARLRTQYWRANVDPSDRYVQSLPGTGKYRLKPGDTGFDNLVIAGDWTDNGLNAGCIEAATRSGAQAAAAVADRLAVSDPAPVES